MSPTIEDGDAVFYIRITGTINRQDIIYVRMPDGSTLIKRVVALAGDTIDIKDGKFTVNGEVMDDFGPTEAHGNSQKYPATIEKDHVFVMGDNRGGSVDSRDFGPIALDQVKGKFLFHR